MLIPKRVWVSCLVTLLVAVLLAWYLAVPAALQHCVSEKPYPHTHQQNESNFAVDRLTIRANASCIFGFVETHNVWVLMVATVGLAIYTAMLWGATNDLVRESKRASIKQARLMRKSVRAMRTASDASVASERAYLMLNMREILELNQGRALHSGAVWILKFTNFGRTPAIVEKVIAYCQFWLGDTIQDKPRQIGTPLSSGDSLYPPISVEVTATKEEIARARAGDGAIALIGRAEYSDIFGEPHVTAFCWQYDFEVLGFVLVQDAKLNYYT